MGLRGLLVKLNGGKPVTGWAEARQGRDDARAERHGGVLTETYHTEDGYASASQRMVAAGFTAVAVVPRGKRKVTVTWKKS